MKLELPSCHAAWADTVLVRWYGLVDLCELVQHSTEKVSCMGLCDNKRARASHGIYHKREAPGRPNEVTRRSSWRAARDALHNENISSLLGRHGFSHPHVFTSPLRCVAIPGRRCDFSFSIVAAQAYYCDRQTKPATSPRPQGFLDFSPSAHPAPGLAGRRPPAPITCSHHHSGALDNGQPVPPHLRLAAAPILVCSCSSVIHFAPVLAARVRHLIPVSPPLNFVPK